jgi:type IV pilus assembly protein PilW
VIRHNRGFSMVELMVALTLGLLVTGAIISVFVGSRSAYQSTAGVGALADSGRFALNTIQESARGAGYMECNHATVNTSLSVLNSLGAPMAYDFRYGVGGYEATATGSGATITLPATSVADGSVGDWTPNLDGAFTGATAKQVKGSDVLILRSSVPRIAPAYTTVDVAAGAGLFTVALTAGSLQASQLAVISDCTKSVTFQISGVTGGSPANVAFTGATGAPGNATVALPVGFSAGALVSPVTTVVYYIGVGDDGDSALRRLDLVNGMVNGGNIFTDEEIASDVENMQVLYGIDTTGTQTASKYVTANQVTDFNAVVSVKVAVLSASPPGAAPLPTVAPQYLLLGTTVIAPKDTRLRKVFDMTVTLRNSVQ